MSWSLSISPVPREQFADAVDAAEAGGQDLSLPGVADDVAAAKATMKELAGRLKRPNIGASAGGHCLQEGEGATWHEGFSVSVYGAEEAPPS